MISEKVEDAVNSYNLDEVITDVIEEDEEIFNIISKEMRKVIKEKFKKRK